MAVTRRWLCGLLPQIGHSWIIHLNIQRLTMINILCNDIYELFLSGHKANNRELFEKVFELSRYFSQNPVTLKSLENLFELEKKLMNSKGPHKQFVEKHIFQILSRSSLYCGPELTDNEYLTLNEELIEKASNIKEKQKYIVASKFVSFAIGIFKFIKARDNFNNKRKSLALEILSNISNYYNVPEALELCLLSLKSKKETLILAALEFQENYIRNRGIPLDSEIIEILDKIIIQTKDRSVAVGALDLQVKTGNISEFEALSRIDEWKEKNDYW